MMRNISGSVTFNDIAFFQLVKFNSYSGFMSATFNDMALFNYVRFGKNVDLSYANLDKITPESFDSIGDAYVSSSIRGSHYFFQMAGERHWDNAHYLESSNSFRNAKMAYEKEGIYVQASSMYVKEKDSIRLDMRINKSNPLIYIWLTVWKYTSNYGENPLWFIGWVVAIVLVFAIIYMPIMPDWWPSITFKEYPIMIGIVALWMGIFQYSDSYILQHSNLCHSRIWRYITHQYYREDCNNL